MSFEPDVKGIYFTLNPLKTTVIERAVFRNRLKEPASVPSVSKDDVARRAWLFIDADPCREGGLTNCSATDNEKEKARETVFAIRTFLTSKGWPLPLVADSGNGFHLLYRIDLPVRTIN